VFASIQHTEHRNSTHCAGVRTFREPRGMARVGGVSLCFPLLFLFTFLCQEVVAVWRVIDYDHTTDCKAESEFPSFK
jgi:hypothetical protein